MGNQRQAGSKSRAGPTRQSRAPARDRQTALRSAGSNPAELQRRLGNKGTQAWLAEQGAAQPVQAKLTVGQPDDMYEQEADRVAETVMRMPEPVIPEEEETKVQAKPIVNQITPLVRRMPEEAVEEEPIVQQMSEMESEADEESVVAQRMSDTEPQEGDEEEEITQAKPETAYSPDIHRQVDEDEEEEVGQTKRLVQRQADEEEEEFLQGKFAVNGASTQLQDAPDKAENRIRMPGPLKTGLEQLSGMDLSSIRVHNNASKPAQLNALAYTQEQDIHVGPGQEKHLPHEGWHAVQQMQGRVKPTLQAKGVSINDDEELEREADVMGAKALQMTRVSIKQRRGHYQESTSLQREVGTEGESEIPGEAIGVSREKVRLNSLSTAAGQAESTADGGTADRSTRTAATIARKPAGARPPPSRVPKAVRAALASEQGTPLSDPDGWSEEVGGDVSGARLVTGPRIEQAADSINAKAFTVGHRVFFGAGQSPDYEPLLSHELTHVAQQKDAPVPSAESLTYTDKDGAQEREAQTGEVVSSSPAAIARDEEYMTTEKFIREHRERIGPATATALDRIGARAGNGVFTMFGRVAAGGVEAVLARLRGSLDKSYGYLTAREIASPVPLEHLVDRGRETTRTSEDLITTGSDEWNDDVGTAIANAIALNLRKSIRRVLDRYAAAKAAAQNRAWNDAGSCDPNNAPEPNPQDIAVSHPLDVYVRNAACYDGLYQVGLDAWRSHNPERANVAGVAGIADVTTTLETNSAENPSGFDSGRFYLWIRSNPPEATAEEVALSFFGKTDYAHLITIKSPPLFAFNAAHVWNLPDHLRDSIVAQSPALQREKERRAGRDTGEPRFIGFMVPRFFADDPEGAATGEQDPTGGLPPELADEAALGAAATVAPEEARGRTAILGQMGTNVALLLSIDELAQRFEEFGMVAGESAAQTTINSIVARLNARRDRLAGAEDELIAHWDGHTRAQAEVLGGVLGGLTQAHQQADQQRLAVGASLDDFFGDLDVARSSRLPLQRVAMKFFAAAALSDMPDSARAKLAEAQQASQLFPAEMMELILKEVQKGLSGIGSDWRHQVGDLNEKEQELRARVAELRQLILAGSPEAGQVMQALLSEIQSLQTETVMIANMDMIDQTWEALGSAADSFGVWGEADDQLRKLKRDSLDWWHKWHVIHVAWKQAEKSGSAEDKKDVRTRFDELRTDPKLATFLGTARVAVRDANTRALIAKLIALLAIVVVTMGTGSAVAGFVGSAGLGWGATAATAAVVLTEAATFTALHTAVFVKNPTLSGVAAEFAYNVFLFGALRGVSKALRAGRLGTFLADAGHLGKAEILGQGIVMGSMTLARAEVEKRFDEGEGLTAEEAAGITTEATAMFVAMVVLGRVSQPLLTKLEGAGAQLGSKIRIANQQRTQLKGMAETVRDTKDLELARELMKRDQESLQRDREALEELMTTARENPQFLRDQGMTDADIAAVVRDLGPGLKRMQVAEVMRGVENIGGDTYVVDQAEMPRLLSQHKQAGAEITEGGVDRVTGRRWFQVNHGEGLKMRIFERVGTGTRAGTPRQEAPTPEQAEAMREAAAEAERVVRDRDADLTRLIMEDAGPTEVETVIIGAAQAGTLAHASMPSPGRAIPGLELTRIPQTFNVAPEGSLFARHGNFRIGQRPGELASPAMSRQPGEFTANHGSPTSAADYVRALTMTAHDTGMATLRAKVDSVEVNPRDGSWPSERPLRLRLNNGKQIYAMTVVGATGLGPPSAAGLVGEGALLRAGKLVYAQESLTLPGGVTRVLVIGGGATGAWAAEAAIQAGATRVLWSGRAQSAAEIAPETRAELEALGLTPEQAGTFHRAYNARNARTFERIGDQIELTTAKIERASVTEEGKVRIEREGGFIEVDGVVVATGQNLALPKGLGDLSFRIVARQHNGAERLIALDAVGPNGELLGVRLTGASIMHRGMGPFIEGGPAEAKRFQDLVSAATSDPSVPRGSRGVPGAIFQSNITVPRATENLPRGGSHRPAPTGHPGSRTNDDEVRY